MASRVPNAGGRRSSVSRVANRLTRIDRPAGGTAPGAGALLKLIRDGKATTRAELVELTGLARSTVSQRLDALLARGLLVPAGESPSTGGRPPLNFAFNSSLGVVLAADLGATHSRLAVTDLAGQVLAQHAGDIDIADGPESVLAWLEDHFDRLCRETPRGGRAVLGIGVGIPGPVEFAAGRPVSPPIMPGWDGYPIADRLSRRFSAPALIDNDVNLMALGEHWSSWRGEDYLLFVKVGTGIGCGIIAGGTVHRGAQGAAGDIGHVHRPNHRDVVCRCGNVGCLEAVAGGRAMASQLTDMGIATADAREVVKHAKEGRPEALRLLRQAGREIGEVMAVLVNFFNPSTIVVGGDIAEAHEHLLAGIREVVYQRSLPLATRQIRIVHSQLAADEGVTGAAVMVIEHILAAESLDDTLAVEASGG